ncbi:hypothetical protein QUA13_09410 [Microcoleus sp. S28C3]|uniref:hypothetical protein n=1 Tax=Microcoleus sp. S28C3 TaxID=3055414 RepID=UPI002FD7376E
MTIPIVPRQSLGMPLEKVQHPLKGENNWEAEPPNLNYQDLPGNDKRSLRN